MHNTVKPLTVRKIICTTYINLTNQNIFLPYDDSDYISLPPCGIVISPFRNEKDISRLSEIKQNYPDSVLIGDTGTANSYPEMIVAANVSLIYRPHKTDSK